MGRWPTHMDENLSLQRRLSTELPVTRPVRPMSFGLQFETTSMRTYASVYLRMLGSMVLSVGLPFGQASGQPNGTPDVVSLCDVLARPETFSGKLIRFRASVSTDGFEFTTLYDPSCNQGVGPWSSEATDTHQDVKEFNRAVDAQSPGAKHQRIEGTFTGLFSYDSQATNVTKRREILKVDDLKVSGKPPKRWRVPS